ncbi:MAG: hypothetical protein AAFZ52_00490, partial [Bacteroidota bacterium]
VWHLLLWALPLTVFYLTPPLPGWRRLRDLPYLKGVWVGLAWSIMTVDVPVAVISEAIDNSDLFVGLNIFVAPGSPNRAYPYEVLVRFLFTFAAALLFDLRDRELDRSQGVKTIANELPVLHRTLVFGCLTLCGVLTHHPGGGIYFAMLPVAFFTYQRADEDWYAVVVNGLLLTPPAVYFLLGAGAGAG